MESERLVLGERFLRKVAITGRCWEWLGAKTWNGYGTWRVVIDEARFNLAHRACYSLFNGEIPAGKVVMHTCDNRGCVNPAHLALGTQSENIKDAFRRGRKVNVYYGPKTGRERVLNPEKAAFIKANPEMTLKSLAQMCGCSLSAVHSVKIGRTWKK